MKLRSEYKKSGNEVMQLTIKLSNNSIYGKTIERDHNDIYEIYNVDEKIKWPEDLYKDYKVLQNG